MIANTDLLEISTKQLFIQIPIKFNYQITARNVTLHQVALKVFATNPENYIIQYNNISGTCLLDAFEETIIKIHVNYYQEQYLQSFENNKIVILAFDSDFEQEKDNQNMNLSNQISESWQQIQMKDMGYYIVTIKLQQNLYGDYSYIKFNPITNVYERSIKVFSSEGFINDLHKKEILKYVKKFGEIAEIISGKSFIIIKYQDFNNKLFESGVEVLIIQNKNVFISIDYPRLIYREQRYKDINKLNEIQQSSQVIHNSSINGFHRQLTQNQISNSQVQLKENRKSNLFSKMMTYSYQEDMKQNNNNDDRSEHYEFQDKEGNASDNDKFSDDEDYQKQQLNIQQKQHTLSVYKTDLSGAINYDSKEYEDNNDEEEEGKENKEIQQQQQQQSQPTQQINLNSQIEESICQSIQNKVKSYEGMYEMIVSKTESISNDIAEGNSLKDSRNVKIIFNHQLQTKQENIMIMFLTNSGTYLVLITKDKKIKVYNWNLNIMLKEFTEYQHLKNDQINFAKKFMYDINQNDLFIVGGSDKCLRIYNCQQLAMTRHIKVKRKSNYCFTLIRSRHLLVVGGKNISWLSFLFGKSTRIRNIKFYDWRRDFKFQFKISLPSCDNIVTHLESIEEQEDNHVIIACVLESEFEARLIFVNLLNNNKGQIVLNCDMYQEGIRNVEQFFYSPLLQKFVCLENSNSCVNYFYFINLNFKQDQIDCERIQLFRQSSIENIQICKNPENIILAIRENYLIIFNLLTRSIIGKSQQVASTIASCSSTADSNIIAVLLDNPQGQLNFYELFQK